MLTAFSLSQRIALIGLAAMIALAAYFPAIAQDAEALADVLANNPYAARIVVEDQSTDSRDKALRATLMAVLHHAAGGSDLSFSAILPRASELVQHFGFEHDPQSGALYFTAAYDAGAIERSLREHGLPVFGVESGPVEATLLVVRGINSAAQYSALLRKLQSAPGIAEAQVLEAQDDWASLRLSVRGGLHRLGQSLMQVPGLVPEMDGSYRWTGAAP